MSTAANTRRRTKSKTKPKATAAGDWMCPECGQVSAPSVPICERCDEGFRPDLSVEQKLLTLALEPNEEAAAHWQQLAAEGAGDDLILSAVATALELNFAGWVEQDGLGVVSWDTSDHQRPRLWWTRPLNHSNTRRAADCEGPLLVTLIRNMYRIGKPAAAGSTANGKPPGKTTKAAKPPATADVRPISVHAIDPHPQNPRKHFDPEKLRALANSLTRGQIHPAIVRPLEGGRYQLLSGERRWQAAQLAGLPTLRCEVVEANEDAALRILGEANEDAEPLNPLERILWYQSLLDAGGYTQEQLATERGIAPSTLSNLLRILRLPDDLLQEISREKLPLTHARECVRWAERPKVMDRVREQVKYGVENLYEFKMDIQETVFQATKPVAGDYFCHQTYRRIPVALSKKDREREELDVEEFKGGGKRCWNVALWEELQSAGLERRAKKSSSAGSDATESNAELSPAERKAKDEQKARAFAARLYDWKLAWLQEGIRDRLHDQRDNAALLVGWVLWFAARPGYSQREKDLQEELSRPAEGCSPASKAAMKAKGSLAVQCSQLDEFDFSDVCLALLLRWVMRPAGHWHSELDGQTIEEFAAVLSISPKDDWIIRQDYLELHTKAQLEDLAREWSIPQAIRPKRADMIEQLMRLAPPRQAPKAFVSAKGR